MILIFLVFVVRFPIKYFSLSSCLLSMFMILIFLVFVVRFPIKYFSLSFHHGISKEESKFASGLIPGTCRKRPWGQYTPSRPVGSYTHILGSLVSGSNQCVMSVPAAAMIGSIRGSSMCS